MEDPEPRWLTAEQLDAWLPIGALLLSLPSALDRQLQRDSGITFFAYLVLAALSDGPDRTRPMRDLAAVASGSLSRLSHTVRNLEERGWVRRRPCPGDGRTTLATLTDEGAEFLAAAAPGHVAAVRRMVVDALSDTELQRLGEAAEAIVARAAPEVAELLRRR